MLDSYQEWDMSCITHNISTASIYLAHKTQDRIYQITNKKVNDVELQLLLWKDLALWMPETTFACHDLFAMFLRHNVCPAKLITLFAFFVLCRKYEEICAPRVEDFCFITDSTYTREEICTLTLTWPT